MKKKSIKDPSNNKTNFQSLKNTFNRFRASLKSTIEPSTCANETSNISKDSLGLQTAYDCVEDFFSQLALDYKSEKDRNLIKYYVKRILIELQIREAAEKMIDCYVFCKYKCPKKCLRHLHFHISCSSMILKILYFKLSKFNILREFEIYYTNLKIGNKVGNLSINDDEVKFSKSTFDLKQVTQTLKLNNLKPIQILGSGNFGEVILVGADGKGVYALKKLKKVKEQMRKVCIERNIHILGTLENNPFIMRFYASFQTKNFLYILMECANRGSLKNLLNIYQSLNLNSVRFYSACCILGLEFLHKYDIVHRDIKPDNILIDQRGYAKLTDFGICKPNVNWFKFKNSVAGTLDYCAPEVLSKLYYDNSIDFWSLGITIYKMITGKNPFHLHIKKRSLRAKDRAKSEVKRKILFSSIYYMTRIDFKIVNNLIRRLTRRVPIARLGNGPNGVQNIKMHTFYSIINWYDLSLMKVEPPSLAPLILIEDALKSDKIYQSLFQIEDNEDICEGDDFLINFDLTVPDW